MRKKEFRLPQSSVTALDRARIREHEEEHQQEMLVAQENLAKRKIPRMLMLRMCHKDA
jgi:hypothetical protein